MRREIGSFFHTEQFLLTDKNCFSWLPKGNDFSFTFSGRAAIELALLDIKSYKSIKNVYMPTYCCQSMIQPFLDAEINVIFYDVFFDEEQGMQYNIDLAQECDIFFAMSYFGLETSSIEYAVNKFSNSECIIIEDVTHRLLSKENGSLSSHYLIASLRKWFGISSGGITVKKKGLLSHNPYKSSDDLIGNIVKAMEEKKRYLNGDNIDKEGFLSKFNGFEKELEQINCSYKIDKMSKKTIKYIDIKKVINRRKANAQKLYDELRKFDNIELLLPNPDFSKDCPLFVPIIVKNGNRNKLRQHFIDNEIYLPIHWPITNYMKSESQLVNSIYDNELSIVCDQRYSEVDMIKIIKTLESFFNKESI